MESLRAYLLKRVEEGTDTVVAFQKLCGVSTAFPPAAAGSAADAAPTPVIRYRFLHAYFLTAAALGNELFYIIALPALFWLVSPDLARRVVLAWVMVYFLGQSAKDLLTLPRPPSPPVTQLERHYAAEYGFPSTHAMVSLALPLYALSVWSELSSSPVTVLGLLLAAAWTTSITLSRLYVGVHSPADIAGGLLLGSAVLLLCRAVGGMVDSYLSLSVLGPVVVVMASIALILCYPSPGAWTNAYGDTALIIATTAGIFVGQNAAWWGSPFPALDFPEPADDSTRARLVAACAGVVFALVRMLVGCTILFLTRSLVKKFSHAIWLPLVLPKYFAYVSSFPSPSSSPSPGLASSPPSASPSPSTNTSPRLGKRGGKASAAEDDQEEREESGNWQITASPTAAADTQLRQRKAGDQSNAESSPPTILSPKALRPVPPQQFRLNVTLNSSSTLPPRSPLGLLLSPSPSPTHRLLADPLDPKTTLVEFDVAGQTVLINPLHVYLVEIPIKYATYFAVGFNATCVCPFLFALLGI